MLTSVVATDRNKVQAFNHGAQDRKWLSVALTQEGGDYHRIEVSISHDVARRLVEQLEQRLSELDNQPSNLVVEDVV